MAGGEQYLSVFVFRCEAKPYFYLDLKQKKAIVIGAGIAGLAASLRLRHKGYAVRVFESNGYAGGKLHAFTLDGYRFDAGPSLFTMPGLVEELFHLFSEDPATHFPYIRKESVCNYFWDDGSQFHVSADPDKFIREAAIAFGEPEQRLRDYLKDSQRKYDVAGGIFLEKSLHKFGTYLSPEVFKALLHMPWLDTGTTLDTVNRKSFRNPRLVQLFNRYATYNGSSPYRTPGIMSMIPHLEMHYGTFLPRKGMHAISQSLYDLAIRQGVKFHLGEPVERIVVKQGCAQAVRTAGGEFDADVVVSNMDVYPTYRKLLPDQPQPEAVLARERSGSALIFYWGIDRTFPELDLHNIFFSNDYQAEFRHQFELGSFADDLTVYVNITSKDILTDAPPGCENWFVMVNAPADTGQDWPGLTSGVRERVLRKLSAVLQTDLSPHIVTEEVLDPPTIASRTSSYRGSLYGTSSNSRFAAFLRHPNFTGRISNLYFCGGSVHPGGGIPLCLLSAKIVSGLVPSAA